MRHDQEFIRPEHFRAFGPVVAIVHRQHALDHKKKLVFRFVVMPNEVAVEFYDLHVKVIELSDDLRAPRFVEERELFREVHLSQLAHAGSAVSLMTRSSNFSGKRLRTESKNGSIESPNGHRVMPVIWCPTFISMSMSDVSARPATKRCSTVSSQLPPSRHGVHCPHDS